MNKSLRDQLKEGVKSGKIKTKHFDGEKKWRDKFHNIYKTTKDLDQTLDIMYGPKGGVDNFKGSLYRNTNVKFEGNRVTKIVKKVIKKPKSKVFDFLKVKKK